MTALTFTAADFEPTEYDTLGIKIPSLYAEAELEWFDGVAYLSLTYEVVGSEKGFVSHSKDIEDKEQAAFWAASCVTVICRDLTNICSEIR